MTEGARMFIEKTGGPTPPDAPADDEAAED